MKRKIIKVLNVGTAISCLGAILIALSVVGVSDKGNITCHTLIIRACISFGMCILAYILCFIRNVIQ